MEPISNHNDNSHGSLRIVIASMGPGEFSLLHAVCERLGHKPVAYTYSRSMRPAGTVGELESNTIGRILIDMPPGVDLLLPAGPAGLAHALAGYRPDVLMVYGYNWILPREVFTLPRLGVINIHPSLLPRYQGPAPILWAIRNGDPFTGVTAHRIDHGMDTGPILVQQDALELDDDIDRETFYQGLTPVVADVATEALIRIADGEPGQPQDPSRASRAPKFEPEFSRSVPRVSLGCWCR